MKKAISILLIFSTMAISCATVDQTSSSTTRVMDVKGAGVLQHPVIGEMEVDIEKVTGTVERSGRVTNIESLKVLAMNDAIKTAGADILVEPTFEIISENSITTVTVTGYPASYTNFRSITMDDVPLLEVGQLQKASVYEVQEQSVQQNSPSRKAVLGVLGVLGLVAFIFTQQ